MNKSVLDFYKGYNEDKRLTSGDNRHLLELLRKRYLYDYVLSDYSKARILQISCGTGVHTKFLLDNFLCHVFACDVVPEHVDKVEQLKGLFGDKYPNLETFVWDCSERIPDFLSAWKFDIVIVEGAWYHLDDNGRDNLLYNLRELAPDCIIMDFLSEFHEVQQQLLQHKTFVDPRNAREPFHFDSLDTALWLRNKMRKFGYKTQAFPVDFDMRFGFRDLNEVPNREFEIFVDFLNKKFQPQDDLSIVDFTEHGSYIFKKLRF